MKTIEEKVAVYRAWLEGKEIEFASDLCKWEPAPSPSWDWHNFDYRVKPEPVKPAVAYAYRHTCGCLYWADNEHVYSDKKYYTRAPEFDIVAKEMP